WLWLCSPFLGCEVIEEPLETPSEVAPVEVSAEEPSDPGTDFVVETTSSSVDGPIQLVFVWDNISPLYQSFFTEAEAIERLGTDLAGLVAAPANIHVRYDNDEFVGDIRLKLRPETLLVPVGISGDVVELQALAGITRALGTFRNDLAARKDLRIGSFRIGLESYRGTTVCIFGATGPHPQDGSRVDPCVEIVGRKHCGEVETGAAGSASPKGLRFEEHVAKAIRTCLDS
ncbi:MAG: hypothetical protein QGG40_05140, partial [Myxococcota bacterium]|nr:hypothetical protein [Myxococcota bacterium]